MLYYYSVKGYGTRPAPKIRTWAQGLRHAEHKVCGAASHHSELRLKKLYFQPQQSFLTTETRS